MRMKYSGLVGENRGSPVFEFIVKFVKQKGEKWLGIPTLNFLIFLQNLSMNHCDLVVVFARKK